MVNYQQGYHILIVDKHQLIIDGLTGILKQEKNIGNIQSAISLTDALEILTNKKIDCVLLDINMTDINGNIITRIIKDINPQVKVVIVSMLSDAPVIGRLIKTGADAFITNDIDKEELLTAIENVMAEKKYISSDFNFDLYEQLENDKNNQPVFASLSSREKEIIWFISQHYTNQQIAQKLFLSVDTIEAHRKNILAKLCIRNTAALVKYAIENEISRYK
ncbi:MAG: response regulator transcription factor [Ferruginibacter sp.]